MEIRQLKANFTIADEVSLDMANSETEDLTSEETRDIIENYIDKKLKEHGIKAFNMRMTYKSRVIDDV